MAKAKNCGLDFRFSGDRSRKDLTARETRDIREDALHAPRPHGPRTNVGHPRDADPSITGQPHQVTGEVPDLMGKFRARMVTRRTCQRRYQCRIGTAATLSTGAPRRAPSEARQAAPRCSASQTAVLSRTPSSTARPQWAIQAATPSGVPDT